MMGMFEYVAVLTSIIVGLGITHLLRGTARLIQHPDAARPYWVHLTWVSYMFLNSVFWWWWEFRLTRLEVWTFQVYVFVILFAVILYMLCALLYPVSLDGYDGFKDYFYSRRGWFFGLSILFLLMDVGDTLLKGTTYFASLGPEYIIVRILKLILYAIAIRSENERLHGLIGAAMLLYQASYAVRVYDTVG